MVYADHKAMNLLIHLAPSTIAILAHVGRGRLSAARCLPIPAMPVVST
jgi:hypothetical protein